MANQFLPFCPTDTGTNLMTQGDYAVAPDRTSGNKPGVASSKLNNKAIRQSSVITSQFAQFMGDTLTEDILDNNDLPAILAQIGKLFNAFMPVGTILPYAGATTPTTKFLVCQGQAVSRTTYAALFAAIGTAWGEGNGTTTFNVPDLQGVVLRGVAGSSTKDPDKTSRTAIATGGNVGNNVGSFQGHAFQTHTHTQNQHRHNIPNLAAGGSAYTNGFAGASTVALNGNEVSAYETATNQNASATGTFAQATANETRMVNVYVNYVIRF